MAHISLVYCNAGYFSQYTLSIAGHDHERAFDEADNPLGPSRKPSALSSISTRFISVGVGRGPGPADPPRGTDDRLGRNSRFGEGDTPP